jgi:hypothetical protein
MSARESWTQHQAQRRERAETALSGARACTEPMNALHRCDRCGAQAYVRVLLPGRQDLLFCAHHYRQHEPALAKAAVDIRDEMEQLTRREWPGTRR